MSPEGKAPESRVGQMNTAAISVSIALAAGAFVAPEAIAARDAVLDFLDAPRATRSPYDSEVRARFFVTPFDCGRYFEDTNFSVSVYLRNNGRKAIVTTIASSQDLVDIPAARHSSIKYTRYDRDISTSTALMLRHLWRLMLERKFLSQQEKDSVPVAVLDAFTGQFSLQLANGRILRADLPLGSKLWGPHVRRFWDLAILLANYSKSGNDGTRLSLEKQIEQKATALTSSLQTVGQ